MDRGVTLRAEIQSAADALAGAYCLIDLARVASTDEGRQAGVFHGLADDSIPDALWVAQEAVRESVGRLKALALFFESEAGEVEPDGGEDSATARKPIAAP